MLGRFNFIRANTKVSFLVPSRRQVKSARTLFLNSREKQKTYLSQILNIRLSLISVLSSRCFETLSQLTLALGSSSRPCVSASLKNCSAVLFFAIRLQAKAKIETRLILKWERRMGREDKERGINRPNTRYYRKRGINRKRKKGRTE